MDPHKPDDNRPQAKKRRSEKDLKPKGSNTRMRTTEPETPRPPTLPLGPVTEGFQKMGLTATVGPPAVFQPRFGNTPEPRPPIPRVPSINPPVPSPNLREQSSSSQSTAGHPPAASRPQQNLSFAQRLMAPPSSRSAIGGSGNPPPTPVADPGARITAENTSRAVTLPAAPSRGPAATSQSKVSDEKFLFDEVAPGLGLYEVPREMIFEGLREVAKIGTVDGYRKESIDDRNFRELVGLLKSASLVPTLEVIFRFIEWTDGRSSYEPFLLFRFLPVKPVDIWVLRWPKTEPEGIKQRTRIQTPIRGCFVGLFKFGKNSPTKLELSVQFFDVNRRDGSYPGSLVGWKVKAKPGSGVKPKSHVRLFPFLRALFGMVPHLTDENAVHSVDEALKQVEDDLTIACFGEPVQELDCRGCMAAWFKVFGKHELCTKDCTDLTFWAPKPEDIEKMRRESRDDIHAASRVGRPVNGKDIEGLILFKPRFRIRQDGSSEYSYRLSREMPDKLLFGEERVASHTATQQRQDEAQAEEQEQGQGQGQARQEPRQQPRSQPGQQQQQQQRVQRKPQLTGAGRGYGTPRTIAPSATRQPHPPPSELGSAPAQSTYGTGYGQGPGTAPVPYGAGGPSNIPQSASGGLSSSSGRGSSYAGQSTRTGQVAGSYYGVPQPYQYPGQYPPGQAGARNDVPTTNVFDEEDYTGAGSRSRDEDADDDY